MTPKPLIKQANILALYKRLQIQIHSVFKGLKEGPFKHTKYKNFAKCFELFFNIHIKCI